MESQEDREVEGTGEEAGRVVKQEVRGSGTEARRQWGSAEAAGKASRDAGAGQRRQRVRPGCLGGRKAAELSVWWSWQGESQETVVVSRGSWQRSRGWREKVKRQAGELGRFGRQQVKARAGLER